MAPSLNLSLMIIQLEFLVSGMALGLAAGMSPGPLLTLVVSETLKRGRGDGIRVAVAPLVTDLPITLFVLFILLSLEGFRFIIGLISIFGACYLTYLGLGNLREKGDEVDSVLGKGGALKKGVIANFLSPSPYLFWLSIGGPLIFKSLEVHVSASLLFVAGFYCLLIGSKIGVALMLERSKAFIKSRHYVLIVRVLGVILILFALIFVKDGLELMTSQ